MQQINLLCHIEEIDLLYNIVKGKLCFTLQGHFPAQIWKPGEYNFLLLHVLSQGHGTTFIPYAMAHMIYIISVWDTTPATPPCFHYFFRSLENLAA